jgi:hypothetical protein
MLSGTERQAACKGPRDRREEAMSDKITSVGAESLTEN